jgi:hypothetical protein
MADKLLAQFKISKHPLIGNRNLVSLGLVSDWGEVKEKTTTNSMKQTAAVLIDQLETINTHTEICEVEDGQEAEE